MIAEKSAAYHMKVENYYLKYAGEVWAPVRDMLLTVSQFHDHLDHIWIKMFLVTTNSLSLTRPRADSELLIIMASFNVLPSAPVLLTLRNIHDKTIQ